MGGARAGGNTYFLLWFDEFQKPNMITCYALFFAIKVLTINFLLHVFQLIIPPLFFLYLLLLLSFPGLDLNYISLNITFVFFPPFSSFILSSHSHTLVLLYPKFTVLSPNLVPQSSFSSSLSNFSLRLFHTYFCSYTDAICLPDIHPHPQFLFLWIKRTVNL